MAVTTFIPKLWSAALLTHLDKAHVFANLVNRDYEGDISDYGDTVHINQIGDITVKKYTKGTDIAAPEDISTTEQLLVIDQAEYFNFGIDDIDAAQARTDLMDKAMMRAAYGLADTSDTYLAGLMATGAKIKIGNTTTPIAITSENAYSTLVDIKIAMDKKNVPKIGRWVVLPPDYEGALLLDDRFVKGGIPQSDERLTNGFIGRAAGFDVYTSNNCPVTASKYSVIASVNMATTYAEQIVKTEGYRPEKSFKDAMKGLNVYGAKVTMGDAIAVATVTFGA